MLFRLTKAFNVCHKEIRNSKFIIHNQNQNRKFTCTHLGSTFHRGIYVYINILTCIHVEFTKYTDLHKYQIHKSFFVFSFFFCCPRPPACISLCIYLPFDLLYHSQMAGVNRIEVHCWHVIYVCRMWCKWVCVWVCVCGLCGACGVCGCKRVSLGVCDVM